MTGGTVNIARSIWDDAAFKDEPMTEREAFVWLIMEASWKPRERRVGRIVVALDRGELASSVRFMADAWGWSKSRVSRFLARLRDRDMIENRDTSGTVNGTPISVIRVCNYDEYQAGGESGGTPREAKAGQKRDRSGTNEKTEAIRGKKKDNPQTPFDAFWSEYPRKEAKGAARKAYTRAVRAVGPDVILSGLRRYALSVRHQEPRYIAHAATWLNAERWTDEPQEAPHGRPASRPRDFTSIEGGRADRGAPGEQLQRAIAVAARGTSGEGWG